MKDQRSKNIVDDATPSPKSLLTSTPAAAGTPSETETLWSNSLSGCILKHINRIERIERINGILGFISSP